MPAMRQSGEQLDLLQGQGAGYLPGPQHSPCKYFAGTMLWSCWYGIKQEAPKEKPKAAEQALPDTRGGRAVEKFRQNMRAIEKRLTHKE